MLASARVGDAAAVDALYRRHVEAARRLAMALAGPSLADDLVAESFERVITLLRRGKGPNANFRAYLHATIRTTHIDMVRRAVQESPASDQPWIFDAATPGPESATGIGASLDASTDDLVAAFASLPPRWRQVLWHLEVEGLRPAEVAVLMSTTPNAVGVLRHRARTRFKGAYLAGESRHDPGMGRAHPIGDRHESTPEMAS